jgi:hypothetical protein
MCPDHRPGCAIPPSTLSCRVVAASVPNGHRMIDFATFPPRALVAASDRAARTEPALEADESCDVCGATTLAWRKCKLVCLSCRSIVKSCADL